MFTLLTRSEWRGRRHDEDEPRRGSTLSFAEYAGSTRRFAFEWSFIKKYQETICDEILNYCGKILII